MENIMTVLVENLMPNVLDSYATNVSSKLSENNKKHIHTIRQFNTLYPNWDSYNASKPSSIAIDKAITFALSLSEKSIDIFFVAPTPDGDIVVELKDKDASLEFVFSDSLDETFVA